MKDIFKFIRWGVVILAILMGFPAQAENVLILNVSGEPWGGSDYISNLYNEFSTVATVDQKQILGTENSVDASTFKTSAGTPYDIVVVANVFNAINATNWVPIKTAVQAGQVKAFLFFNDGCSGCNLDSNFRKMLEVVNEAGGLSITYQDGDSVGNDGVTNAFLLNQASLLKNDFSGLDPLYGIWVGLLANTPVKNALYLQHNDPNPPISATVSAISLMIPRGESYGGTGSCVFATGDMDLFQPSTTYYGANQGKIAPAFISAVTNPYGACNISTTQPVQRASAPVPSLSAWGLIVLSSLALMIFWRAQQRRH